MNNPRIEDIRRNLAQISEDVTVLDILLETERIMNEIGMFAYANWDEAELVDGPEIDKFSVTTTWMFPKDMMPDPRGGMRLVKYGCKVFFKEGKFKYYKEVKSPADVSSDPSRAAIVNEVDVWLVKVRMPKRFIDNGLDELISIETGNTMKVDTSDLENAEAGNELQ